MAQVPLSQNYLKYISHNRIVLPANLYYKIVERQDTYTQEDTKAILRRIGFDLDGILWDTCLREILKKEMNLL